MRFSFWVRSENQNMNATYYGHQDAALLEAEAVDPGATIHGHTVVPPGTYQGDVGIELAYRETEKKVVSNRVKEYKIDAPKNAYARIIIVSRDSGDQDPIYLNDFMKDADLWSMGDEGHRMRKYFYRGRKTKSDILRNVNVNERGQEYDTANANVVQPPANGLFADKSVISMERQRELADVQVIHDKVYKLRVDGETVVKINTLKGKTLKYEHANQSYTFTDGSAGNDVDVDFANAEGTGTSQFHLPVSTNECLREMKTNPPTGLTAKVHEYVPLGRKYAAYLFLMNSRTETHYEVYQKFDFDK